jgi:hypothetical protein
MTRQIVIEVGVFVCFEPNFLKVETGYVGSAMSSFLFHFFALRASRCEFVFYFKFLCQHHGLRVLLRLQARKLSPECLAELLGCFMNAAADVAGNREICKKKKSIQPCS